MYSTCMYGYTLVCGVDNVVMSRVYIAQRFVIHEVKKLINASQGVYIT